MTLPIALQSGSQILETGQPLANSQSFLQYLNGKLSGPLSIQATGFPLPINSTGTQVLGSYVLPGGTLSATNQGVRIKAQGITGSTGNIKSAILNFGNNSFTTTGITDNGTGWVLEMDVFKTGANTQQVNGWGYHNTTLITPTSGTGTNADTANITISIAAITSTASGDITVNNFTVELLQ